MEFSETQPIFELITSDSSGLDFSNKLSPTNDLNIFSYMYFYNGGGVGIVDLNNDNLPDIVFTGNQVRNEIYLNKGNLKFENATELSGFISKGWSTGVNFNDINNDGLMDIYITQVNNDEQLSGSNLLFVCKEIDSKGIPHYIEQAPKYGLNFKGYGTQSAFFDYDLDGDLDLYLLNHSVHKNGTFGHRSVHLIKYHDKAGDKIYRNENGHFTDVTKSTSIYSNALGYGLGIKISDINLDGWPDIYIGNDFHENDYLYINQKNGTFKDELDVYLAHTSRYTMGVDIADFNNDLYPDIFTLDMHPDDYKTLKKSEGEDLYNIYLFKLSQGYNQQYSRNMLHLNRKNGFFSEIGIYSGVHASDWSWSTFFADFNNDGNKDIFISNGIPRRMNDIDYIDYIVDDVIQNKVREKKMDESDLDLLGKLPEIKILNKFYFNTDSIKFKDATKNILNHTPSFSNGAAYADLDNDGDMEIVSNNINEQAFLYKNLTVEKTQSKQRKIILNGQPKNRHAIGAKIIVFSDQKKFYYENFIEKGFQSSMSDPISISTASQKIDSILVIWPDQTFQLNLIKDEPANIVLDYRSGSKARFNFEYFGNTNENGVQVNIIDTSILHIENDFAEFDREALMPFMTSTEGPALAIADVNSDGQDDVFLGGSRYFKAQLFLQKDQKWISAPQPEIEADSMYEDAVAAFADFNGDKHLDLLVGSGGSEFFNKSEFNTPRIYINNGSGIFKKMINAFTIQDQITASALVIDDFNKDGLNDFFIGARSIPWAYGKRPYSRIYINSKDNFKDSTLKYLKDSDLGMVKDAQSIDFDKDGDNDILIASEWEPLRWLEYHNENFLTRKLPVASGFWNCARAIDLDQDGDLDLFAGNLGLNTKLKATPSKPIKMYYDDFDLNDKKEQAITYYHADREVPFATFKEILKQMPSKKKSYQYASDFANLSVQDVFSSNLKKMQTSIVNETGSVIFENIGDGKYKKHLLPAEAQWSIIKDVAFDDIDHDGRIDIIPVGNYYETNTQLGRIDADPGIVLCNQGGLSFISKTYDKPILRGQSRRIIKSKDKFYIAKNDGKFVIINLSAR